MMARIVRHILLALALVVAAGGVACAPHAAHAQDTLLDDMPEGPNAELAKMSQSLDEAARELRGGLITDNRLRYWRDRFGAIKSDAQRIADAASARVESVRSLLEALGPPPEDATEPAPVANERGKLNRELERYVGLQKQAELVLARVNELRRDLVGTQRERFTERLLTRGPSIFEPATWHVAATDIIDGTRRSVAALIATPQKAETNLPWGVLLGLNMVVLFVVVGLALPVRWTLMRRYGRDPAIAEPRYITRLVAAALEGLFRAIVPALAAGAVYAMLHYQGLLVGLMDTVAEATAKAVAFFSLVHGLTKAVLAPNAPAWRVIHFTDDCARKLGRMIVALAAFFAVDFVLFRIGQAMALSMELAVVHNTLVGAVVAVIVLRMMSPDFWRRADTQPAGAGGADLHAEETTPPPDEAIDEDEDGATSGEIGKGLGIALAIAIGATALAIPIASALGYFVLGRFLTERLILSGVLVTGLVLLRGLIHELVTYAMRPDAGLGKRLGGALGLSATGLANIRLWFLILVDLLLLAGGALLALALWGVSWAVIGTWLSTIVFGASIGGITISLIDLATAAAVFFVALALTRFIQRVLNRQVFRPINMDIGVRQSLNAAISYTGIVVAILLAIAAMGLDLSNLAIIAGALSVGIGFGLQTIVNNFVSGLILLIERPIKAGDWVVVGQHEGFVKKINVRATEIETFDRSHVIVPNSEFVSTAVTNWTHRNRQCRLIISVRVPYGCDTEQVHDLLMACARRHRDILRWPAPHVLFRDFGESGLVFELRCYARDVDYFLSAPSELRFDIDERLRAAGIQIPYPMRDIYVRTVPWPEGEVTSTPAPEPDPHRDTGRAAGPARPGGQAAAKVPESGDAPEGIE
jgi:small-conductance mechanosensitive channel